MQKYFISVGLVLCYLITSFGQSTLINIDENWKFHPGSASDPAKDFNYGIGNVFWKTMSDRGTAIDLKFDDSNWRTLDLPHDWVVELPFVNSENPDVAGHGYKPVGGLFPETSIGWYRKKFNLEATDSVYQHFLRFDGVFRDADFWVNGFYMGNNKSGYIGVTYDMTDFLNYGGENIIVVRVDATQYEGWFYEGAGIYRHVWHRKTPKIHIAEDGIFNYTKVSATGASIFSEIEVENSSLKPEKIVVQIHFLDRNGHKLASSTEKKLEIQAKQTGLVKQELIIKNPRLWTLEDPYLYRVVIELSQNGKLIDQRIHRLGIRTIDIQPNGVFLNGQHIKLKGTNNHQDHAGVGSALPDYLQYFRVKRLKEMGCNSYRTSHNPPTPELLDACDSLGMLVMDETRLLNSGKEYLDQFRRLLKRDRSRTCVFMWSIGNEEFWIQTTPYGMRIGETMLAMQREMDPSRISTYASDVPQRGHMPNIYSGVLEVIPVRGFNYREDAVASHHKTKPFMPIIGTEMGSTVSTRGIYETDSSKCYLPDKDLTAPWWASTAGKWWPMAAENDYWLGGYIWTGFDYRGEPTPFQWPNISSHFGVMDVCGFPKNLYYYYKSWWSDQDVIQVLPHWNWKQGQKVNVWVFSNADKVELFINGKSQGIKDMPGNRHLEWDVTFEPGVLKAIGYKNGKSFSSIRETSGKTAGTNTYSYKTTMLADGKDATVINITAVDNQNREVPDADNLLHFKVIGDARILGVGNGDPSCHEADICLDGNWKRSLFNGKCQVILQAGKNPGTVILEVTSEGLWKSSAEIFTIAPAENKMGAIPVQGKKQKITKPEIGKIIGADISFLPELEANGIRFSDKGIEKDAIEILKDHGFNYIRLRIFNDPAQPKGYSPEKGFCDLEHTMAMAKRIKAAGMKLLLDFHYSDYWADPGKQFKPSNWQNLSMDALSDSVYQYTKYVISSLKAQGTAPDMVQIGNEINHGMMWPEGHIANPDGLAKLFNAGSNAVLEVEPATIIMLHIALGGQNEESVEFVEQMLERGVDFDVLGQSYYPQWHGSLEDLQNNLHDLLRRFGKDIILVEYSARKEEVHDIIFNLPDGKGKGTFIWEPLSTWDSIFDRKGQSNEKLLIYDEIKKRHMD